MLTRIVIFTACLVLAGCASDRGAQSNSTAGADARPTAKATPAPPASPTPVPKPRLREVQPAEVKRGELVSVSILGSGFPAEPGEAQVFFERNGARTELKADAISAGEEIFLQDRNFNELEPGKYDVIVTTTAGEDKLQGGFAVR